jgi:hypothetical protein
MAKRKKQASLDLGDLGTPATPINFGHGRSAYRRNGRWPYRNRETTRRFGLDFVEATDRALIMELEMRGYQILYPAHECIDRPNLPCPACEMDSQRIIRIA